MTTETNKLPRIPKIQPEFASAVRVKLKSNNGKYSHLPKLLYDEYEAAAILAIDVGTLKGLLRNDETPRHVIRGKLRFTMQDLETIVEKSAKEIQ